MMNIATRTRGSSCLTRGDEIIVTDGFSGVDRCFIKRIYQWDSSLLEESEESADSLEPEESK